MKNTTVQFSVLQIDYESDKLEALRLYLKDRNSTVEQEITETLDSIYKKIVPVMIYATTISVLFGILTMYLAGEKALTPEKKHAHKHEGEM